MDVRRLKVFCNVVELKSFTKAAKASFLTQPSVSDHIRVLEENLGEKLLDRLGREALPTPAGQILYQYARRIIQLRDEAVQAINQYRGSLSGNLALGASTTPGAYILPQLIESFKSHHPSIQIMLKISGTSQVVGELFQGNLELGIIGAKGKDHRLEYEELFSDELVLAVWPGHLWAKREAVSLEELENYPFILRERGSGTRTVMTRILKDFGFDLARLSLVAEMGSTEAVRQSIKARIGVSILSSLAVEEDIRQGSLVSVPIKGIHMPRSFCLVQRKNRQLSPLALAFLDFVHTRVQSSGIKKAAEKLPPDC